MAWNPPSTVASGGVIVPATTNQIIESIQYLKGLAGPVVFSDALLAPVSLDANSVSRMKLWGTPSGSPLTTTPQIVVPDGAGDATQGSMFVGVARSSASAVAESFIMGSATGSTKTWTTTIATALKDIVIDVQSSGEVRIYLANAPTANGHIALLCLWR